MSRSRSHFKNTYFFIFLTTWIISLCQCHAAPSEIESSADLDNNHEQDQTYSGQLQSGEIQELRAHSPGISTSISKVGDNSVKVNVAVKNVGMESNCAPGGVACCHHPDLWCGCCGIGQSCGSRGCLGVPSFSSSSSSSSKAN